MLPVITKITKEGKETTDLISYGFKNNNRIYLVGEIDDSLATEIIAQLEYLDQNSSDDIVIYINSPGGSVTSGFAIVDAMRRCKNDVVTVCSGMAASMGAFILSCGTKGKRYITPLSEVMVHQPLGGAQGQASDIELVAKHIAKTKKRLNEMLAENTGKSIDEVARDCDRDYYMCAEEAIEYGIADKIYSSNI